MPKVMTINKLVTKYTRFLISGVVQHGYSSCTRPGISWQWSQPHEQPVLQFSAVFLFFTKLLFIPSCNNFPPKLLALVFLSGVGEIFIQNL